jgi:secreted trypsin-like serine protease
MVLKLKNPSTKPYVNVNLEPSVPEPEVDPITLIGVGRTAYQGPSPDVLQILNVVTISNNECEKSKGNGYDFKGDITADMVCIVQGDDEGQCNGDSGGPYLMLGDSYENDLQVGLVSW